MAAVLSPGSLVSGDRGLRGPQEPGDPGPAGGGNAASLHGPRVPMPGTRQARLGDPQVTGQGRVDRAFNTLSC